MGYHFTEGKTLLQLCDIRVLASVVQRQENLMGSLHAS